MIGWGSCPEEVWAGCEVNCHGAPRTAALGPDRLQAGACRAFFGGEHVLDARTHLCVVALPRAMCAGVDRPARRNCMSSRRTRAVADWPRCNGRYLRAARRIAGIEQRSSGCHYYLMRSVGVMIKRQMKAVRAIDDEVVL